MNTVYPCCLLNLNWKGDILYLNELLQGTGSAGYLEAVSLGAGLLDIKYIGGESIGNGSLLGVGDVFGICLR